MTYRPERMKFGIFLAPFHRVGENPTLAIDRDIELIEHLDRLGYDEAWIGEHHSAGWELIADPTLVIAAAAKTTRSIKLGTGVTSLPYHHPLMVANRMVQLDHMTRGRAMLGVGPGALTSDAYQMGLDPLEQRRKMDESLEAIMRLLRDDEPVNMETDWFTLQEARLHISSYTRPHLPIAAAHSFSPSGPAVAGKYGIGLLSIAAAQPGGLISLQEAWGWVEEAAAEAGRTADRADWRAVIGIHIAESREQAIADVRANYRIDALDYFRDTLGHPRDESQDVEQAIARGGAIVGTPDDAIEAVENLIELSGGLGGVLGMAHEWANHEATLRSYELWARYVAPHFQGQLEAPADSQKWVAGHREDIFGPRGASIQRAFKDAGREIPQTDAQAGASQRPGAAG